LEKDYHKISCWSFNPDYFEFEIEKSIKKNNRTILTSEVERINSTLEVVEAYLPAATITAITPEDFNIMTEEIEKDLEKLSRQQEEVLDKYSSLQIQKSNLEHQSAIASRLVEELDKDYVFSIENIAEDNLNCPLCGTVYENSIFNKTSILKDKSQAVTQLEDIIEEISSTDKKLDKTFKELNQIRETINGLSTKYEKKEVDQQFTFTNLIESIGGQSLKKNVTEAKKEKLNTITDLNSSIKLATKSQKGLYTGDYIDDINASFNSFLSIYIKMLDAQAVNLSQIDSPLSYIKIVNEGGAAENSRAILAYYIAIFSVVEKYKNEVVSPLVIDTPNQQEQSDNNYSNIVNLIMDKISKNDQVIICAMSNPKLAPLEKRANIIKLDDSKLLSSDHFDDVKKIFDTWDV